MPLEEKLKQIQVKIKQNPLTSLTILITVLLFLLVMIPYWQVNYHGINNAIEAADLENQYRATLAQIIGGVAIGIGLYYTWRRITIAEKDLKATQKSLAVTQKNLKVAQENQITERFTRAIDQLGAIDKSGNPAIEIRLGGIYALERISKESSKDYGPIMEILTAYIRINSIDDNILKENSSTNGNISMDIQSNESTKYNVSNVRKISPDIQAILTVLGRRPNNEETNRLDLHATYLERAYLYSAHLERSYFIDVHLENSSLRNAHFEESECIGAHFEEADISDAYFEGSNLTYAHFEKACLIGAHLSDNTKKTDLYKANFEGADMYDTHFEGALLQEAHFEGVFLGACHLENTFMYDTHLEGACLIESRLDNAALFQTHLERADLKDVHLEGAELIGTHLEEAKNLTIDQLSKVKTLYNAKIDNVLLIPLKENYPILFEKPTENSTFDPENVHIDLISSPSNDFFDFKEKNLLK